MNFSAGVHPAASGAGRPLRIVCREIMKLTCQNVEKVFLSCLFKEGEDTTNRIEADAIVHRVGFHPERLKAATPEIREMLLELPDEFMQSKGGGMSFLNACMTRDGDQWGEHRNMGQLFALGTACGAAKCLMPREMWNMLPGGMPYYAVMDVEPKAEAA